jgi:Gluconate 2-dehydrogenase subunit 3
MKRRRAIWSIAFLGGGTIASIGIFKWFDWHKKPDISYLGSQKKLLEALTETIIPTTDTPGAIEAGVPDFILKMVTENMNIVAQNRFIDGLKAVESYAEDTFGKSYIQCSEEQKNTIMRYFEEKSKPLEGIAGKVQRKVLGDPFFPILKEYTCIGYCTSMVGATQALAYTLVPGRFVGCVPMTPNQKSWATK